MDLTIAAIRSGTDPIGKLPPGAFHRWLDEPINCPKCDASYNLVAEWDQATNRWPSKTAPAATSSSSAKPSSWATSTDHRVTHFETSGVIVKSITPPQS